MNSAGKNMLLKFEVQELQLKDLKTEVINLKEMIKAKNEENAKLKTIVKSQEISLNSVRQKVEKCSSQVGEVVSEQSTSRLLSESEPCLLTSSSFSLKSSPNAPVIVSSYSIPSVDSKFPPTNQSASLSTEAGNQPVAKQNDNSGHGRVSSDWPVFDIHGHTASNVLSISNLGNYKGKSRKICVKSKALSNILDIGPLTTDGSGKSTERVIGNKKFWKDQSKIKTSIKKSVRRIRIKIRCQEKDSRGEKVPGLKFLVKETCTVAELKGAYCCKLNVSVEQLVWKGKILQDDENVQDLEGKVLNATGLTWK